mgnify:CR=1 FL=1
MPLGTLRRSRPAEERIAALGGWAAGENRKQLVGNALRALAGGNRTKDAVVILDGLEMLDGDRIDPTQSRYAQDVFARLKAKGHGQVLNRGELVNGDADVEYFAPIKFRLEPDLLVTVLGGLVYAGDIVLSITGDKIDSGKITLLAERPLDELKQFKHVEAPKEINVAVLRSLFEMLGLPPGLAQQATQGSDEPVKLLQEEVGKLTRRVLSAATDMSGRLSFWGQSLLREEEIRDWRNKLDALKAFSESLEAGEFATIQELAEAVGLAERHVSRQLRLAYLAPEVLKRLTCGREASAVSLYDLCFLAGETWQQQAERAFR